MSYLQEVITDVLENYPDKIERLVFVQGNALRSSSKNTLPSK